MSISIKIKEPYIIDWIKTRSKEKDVSPTEIVNDILEKEYAMSKMKTGRSPEKIQAMLDKILQDLKDWPTHSVAEIGAGR